MGIRAEWRLALEFDQDGRCQKQRDAGQHLIKPNMLGSACLLVQATAVAMLAALEYVGLFHRHRPVDRR